MKKLLFFLVIIGLVGCSKEVSVDLCEDLTCVEGICIDGLCECEEMYRGVNCEIERTPVSMTINYTEVRLFRNFENAMNLELWINNQNGISDVILNYQTQANEIIFSMDDEYRISNQKPIFNLLSIEENDTTILNTYSPEITTYQQNQDFKQRVEFFDGESKLVIIIDEFEF